MLVLVNDPITYFVMINLEFPFTFINFLVLPLQWTMQATFHRGSVSFVHSIQKIFLILFFTIAA